MVIRQDGTLVDGLEEIVGTQIMISVTLIGIVVKNMLILAIVIGQLTLKVS